MVRPSDLQAVELKKTDLDDLERQIDDSIKRYHGWHPWEKAIIDGEYPALVRNAIAKRYKRNGWKYVYHKTSSESGECSSLTSFIFSNQKMQIKYIEKYHAV